MCIFSTPRINTCAVLKVANVERISRQLCLWEKWLYHIVVTRFHSFSIRYEAPVIPVYTMMLSPNTSLLTTVKMLLKAASSDNDNYVDLEEFIMTNTDWS